MSILEVMLMWTLPLSLRMSKGANGTPTDCRLLTERQLVFTARSKIWSGPGAPSSCRPPAVAHEESTAQLPVGEEAAPMGGAGASWRAT